jgi:hypothetical protein
MFRKSFDDIRLVLFNRIEHWVLQRFIKPFLIRISSCFEQGEKSKVVIDIFLMIKDLDVGEHGESEISKHEFSIDAGKDEL